MAKLRKIKSGSALSPPDNREIAQKQMRGRYIRTVKRKRKTSVATIPVSMESGSRNTTFKSGTGAPNYVRAGSKAPEKARPSLESARKTDTYS